MANNLENCDACEEIFNPDSGGSVGVDNIICQGCLDECNFQAQKEKLKEQYDNDDSRFKWRYMDCAQGFVFYLDGKEYTNLKELKEDVNKALS